jgi:hypothetical protein
VLASTPMSSSARLRVNVKVVPIVETPVAVRREPKPGAVIYNLQAPRVLDETYEIRSLPGEKGNQDGTRRRPAILKTLVVVPR